MSSDERRNLLDYRVLTKKRIVTVEPGLILIMIYASTVISVTQQYVYQILATQHNITHENENTSRLCKEGDLKNMSDFDAMNNVQKDSSFILASYSAVSLVPMLFFGVLLGSYSDQVGRKICLLLPLIGGCLRLVVVALIVFLKLNLAYMYIGIVLEGLSGGPVLFLGGCFSYISDITTEDQRAFRMIVLEMCISIGFVIAQLGLGFLIKYYGFLVPILVSLACNLVNILYIACWLRESLHRPDRYQAKLWSLENPKKVLMLYVKDTVDKRRWKLLIAVILIFIAIFADYGRTDVVVLYILGSPFCFTSVMIGFYVALRSFLPGFGSTVLAKLLENRLTEMVFFIIGVMSSTVYCVLTAVVPNTVWLFVVVGINFAGSLPVGMLRSFTSKLVKPDELGALFSSIAWIEHAAMVLGSVILDSVYAVSVSISSNLTFFIIAGIYVVSIVIASVVALILHFEKRKASYSEFIDATEDVDTSDDKDIINER